MIVFQIDIKHVTICKQERNSPVTSHPNAPCTFSVTGKCMKPIAGNIQIIKCFSLIKNEQDSFDAVAHVRTNIALVSSFVQESQTPVLDGFDHV